MVSGMRRTPGIPRNIRLFWLLGLLLPLVAGASPKSEWKEIEAMAEKLDRLQAEAASNRSTKRERTVANDPVLATAVLLNLRLESFIRDHEEDKRWADARALHALIMPEANMALKREVSIDAWLEQLDSLRNLPGVSRRLHGNLAYKWIAVSFNRGEREGLTRGQLDELVEATETFLRENRRHAGAVPLALQAGRVLARIDEDRARGLFERARELARGKFIKLENEAEQELAVLGFRHHPIDLSFEAADGSTVDFSQLRGKVVVVDFWASWCPPCRKEAPALAALYRKYRDAGLAVVGVSLDQDRGKMEAFAKQSGMTWSHYFDGRGWDTKLSRRFAIASIPTVWVIGRDGRLVDHDARGKLEKLVPLLLKRGEGS